MSNWRKELRELSRRKKNGVISKKQFKEMRAEIIARSHSGRPPYYNQLLILFIAGSVCAGSMLYLMRKRPDTPEKIRSETVEKKLDLKVDSSLIAAGAFTMGCTAEQERDCLQWEKPVHKVVISRSFYMMKTEVTQELYKKLMGSNPSHFSSCGENCPVENISWYDTVKFANRLSRNEGLEECYLIKGHDIRWTRGIQCNGWRLPTEAEWEYAARGGQNYTYAGGDEADAIGWYAKNSSNKTHAVCGKQVNGYGLCDMSGNVWEWVWDGYESYSRDESTDPHGPSSGTMRVFRGGGWHRGARRMRLSFRGSGKPTKAHNHLGFRLLKSVH